MSHRVVELDNSNATDWELVNENSSHGSLFHTLKWKRLLEESFERYAVTRYFLIYRDAQPIALCPFFERRISGFKTLVTLPDLSLNPCDHLVTDDSCNVERLVEICEDIARSERASFITFGVCGEHPGAFARLGVPLYSTGGRMVLDLSKKPPDWIWKHEFSNNQRNKIRRFDKDGFVLDHITSREGLATFYPYYTADLQRIGGRPHPLSYFEKLLTAYPGESPDGVMLTVLRKGESVAGGLLALFWNVKRILYWRYFSLNRSLPNVYTPFYYLVWHAVKEAYERGCRIIDFGGTPPDPTDAHHRMKAEFGCSYLRRYRVILPVSRLSKVVHWGFGFSARHGLLLHGLAPQARDDAI